MLVCVTVENKGHTMQAVRANAQNTHNPEFSQLTDEVIWAAGISLVSGIASYLHKSTRNGPNGEPPPKFRWLEFVAHKISSMLAGLLAYHALRSVGVDDNNIRVCAAIASGWAGPAAMDFAVYVWRVKVLTFFNFTDHARREHDPSLPPQRGQERPGSGRWGQGTGESDYGRYGRGDEGREVRRSENKDAPKAGRFSRGDSGESGGARDKDLAKSDD